MRKEKTIQQISFWIRLLGIIISVYGLFQNRSFYIILGVVFFTSSALLSLKLLSTKRKLKKSNIILEGRSIDALSLANLKRLHNESLKVQEAVHWFRIFKNDLIIFFKYIGYCKNKSGENGFIFSIDEVV